MTELSDALTPPRACQVADAIVRSCVHRSDEDALDARERRLLLARPQSAGSASSLAHEISQPVGALTLPIHEALSALVAGRLDALGEVVGDGEEQAKRLDRLVSAPSTETIVCRAVR
jgi:hypothetical protein